MKTYAVLSLTPSHTNWAAHGTNYQTEVKLMFSGCLSQLSVAVSPAVADHYEPQPRSCSWPCCDLRIQQQDPGQDCWWRHWWRPRITNKHKLSLAGQRG